MDGRTLPDDEQPPANEAPRARHPVGESREQVMRILRRNRELLEGKVSAHREGTAPVGGGHTEPPDPSSGVTRGDYCND